MEDAPAAVARPSRRAVLVAAPGALLAAALGGCTAGGGRDGAPAPAPSPDPDDALRQAAAERERELLREYDAVLAAVPALAPRLTPLRAHHDAHLAALLRAPAAAAPEAGTAGAGAAGAGAAGAGTAGAGAPGSSDPSAGDGPSGSTAPGTSPSAAAAPASAPAGPVPVDPAAAVARLVTAERAAGAAHGRDCLAASRDLAPVLASLSASELSHPVALA